MPVLPHVIKSPGRFFGGSIRNGQTQTSRGSIASAVTSPATLTSPWSVPFEPKAVLSLLWSLERHPLCPSVCPSDSALKHSPRRPEAPLCPGSARTGDRGSTGQFLP